MRTMIINFLNNEKKLKRALIKDFK